MDFEDDWPQDDGLTGGLPAETRVDEHADIEDIFGDDEPAGDGLAGPGPLDDEPLQPSSPLGGPSTAEERRRNLQELVRSQQQKGGGEDEEGGAKKKRRRKDKAGGKADGEDGGGRRPRRLRGGPAGGGSDGEGGGEGGGEEGGGGGADDEVPPESDADRGFIDDEGVPEHERYHEDPEAEDGGEPEAEEAAEGEEEEEGGFVDADADVGDDEEDAFGKKRKRKERETDLQLQGAVESMIAKMNIAAELDESCVEKARPATHKVKELPAVEAFLRQRKYHEMFILHGGLNAASKWIAPYANGALPTLLVRARMVELLALLPINTAIDSLRDVLMRSGLGKVVQFHAGHVGEGTEREEGVKRAYRKLLHTWVEPIVHDPEREREKRERQAALGARQRRLAVERSKAEADALDRRRAADAAVQPGQKGFRRHAYIPTAAKLDYVHNPGTAAAGGGGGGRRRGEEDEDNDGGFGAMAAVAAEPGQARRGGGGGGGGGAAEMNPLDRRMRENQRNKKGTAARAAKVSVEGRNITLM
ncbi:MAG: hypothetical protein J3K34DRAFT_519697 [Monoraphidium minutum]|nr:MAG: hypothetical protein J3K34DRAFT_519697 [Monoraphidium minutum]